MAPPFLVGQLCSIVDLDAPAFFAEDRSTPVQYSNRILTCPDAEFAVSNLYEAWHRRVVCRQSCAGACLCGAKLGVHTTIVMPADAPRAKVEATRRYSAEVVFYGRKTQDREAIGQRLAAESGAIIVPPCEDAHVIAGQGTAPRIAGRPQQRSMPHSMGSGIQDTAIAIEAYRRLVAAN